MRLFLRRYLKWILLMERDVFVMEMLIFESNFVMTGIESVTIQRWLGGLSIDKSKCVGKNMFW
jgi:hypothetical protein